MLITDELLDLVDCTDNVIGQASRSKIYEQGLNNFRVVNAFLMNDRGQLWIPRRSSAKRLFPLCLDASMGGHVMSGESYENAFRRELMEELRIDALHTSYEYIGNLTPHEHGTSAFMRVYLLHTNDVPDYNSDDFTDFLWLTPAAFFERIAQGDRCKGDLPHIITHLLMHR